MRMGKKYRIKGIEFDTYEEYLKGLADVKKIYNIVGKVDINDPDTALRLYNLIRDGKIKLYSKIGKRFFLDIADIVAQNAETMIDELETDERKQRVQDRPKKILGVVCLAAAILCFLWYFLSDYTNLRGNQLAEHLKDLQAQGVADTINNNTFVPPPDAVWTEEEEIDESSQNGSPADSGTGEMQEEQFAILPEYKLIYEENTDFIGWITIDETKIDYPVMQRKEDNNFYLKRNFNKEEDINGTLFIDYRNDIMNRSTNVIIYGHNMKSGQMFGQLKNYQDSDYWMAHKKIQFNTLYEKAEYEIIAVCLAEVEYQDEEVFRYYNFIDAGTEEEFNDFIRNIEQMAVVADPKMAVYGDELLTLSTCSNYIEDGRLFVVAKKCRDAE